MDTSEGVGTHEQFSTTEKINRNKNVVLHREGMSCDTYTYIITVGIHMYEFNHSAHECISRGPRNRFRFEESKTSFCLLKINRIEGCLFTGVNIYIYT